jgi:hypothetical protein
MKQSQKNIQIVKVQVGDLRKKRKVKKKGKGKSKTIVGTGLQPVMGQTEYFTPPMFPTSRAGTQFEPPKQQVVEKKEDPLKDALKDAEMSLEILKKLQETTKGKQYGTKVPYWADRPRPFNVPTSEPPSPFEAGNYWTQYRFDSPQRPIDRPQQPLVAAEAASSSSSLPFQDKKVPKYIKPKQNIYSPEEIQLRREQGSLSRAFLRGLPFRDSEDKTTLRDVAEMLNIGIPERVGKDELVEIIYSYRDLQ